MFQENFGWNMFLLLPTLLSVCCNLFKYGFDKCNAILRARTVKMIGNYETVNRLCSLPTAASIDVIDVGKTCSLNRRNIFISKDCFDGP